MNYIFWHNSVAQKTSRKHLNRAYGSSTGPFLSSHRFMASNTTHSRSLSMWSSVKSDITPSNDRYGLQWSAHLTFLFGFRANERASIICYLPFNIINHSSNVLEHIRASSLLQIVQVQLLGVDVDAASVVIYNTTSGETWALRLLCLYLITFSSLKCVMRCWVHSATSESMWNLWANGSSSWTSAKLRCSSMGWSYAKSTSSSTARWLTSFAWYPSILFTILDYFSNWTFILCMNKDEYDFYITIFFVAHQSCYSILMVQWKTRTVFSKLFVWATQRAMEKFGNYPSAFPVTIL